MDHKTKASAIIEKVGGQENVSNLQHCVTRLRFKIKNLNLVDREGLQKIEGVIGIREQGDGVQVIVGEEVEEIFDAINHQYTFAEGGSREQTPPGAGKKQNLFIKVMAVISDCLVPMLPALVASGLTAAVLIVLSTFNLIDNQSQAYKILDLMADAPLYFVPFMVVWGASRKFEVSPIIPFAVMAILLHPEFMNLAGQGQQYASLFGLPIRMFKYSSTIVPSILVVILQKYIGGWIHKHTWKKVAMIVEPLATFLILAVLMMVVFGPLGSYVGGALSALIIGGSENYAWLICFILGAFGNFLVGTGMHYVMMPAVITIFTTFGYDNFYGGAAFAGAFALAGSVLGAFFKTKNADRKQIFGTTGTTALIGIAEPAIYGVFFKYRSIMLADCIAGGTAGLLAGFLRVHSYGMAPAGIFTVPMFAGPTFMNLIIVISVGFVLSFVLSYVFYNDNQEVD